MTSVAIALNLEPFSFKDKYPAVQIIHNDKIIADFVVVEHKDYEFTVTPNESNVLKIYFYNKNFGENNIWDTNDTEDLKIKINKILLDGANIESLLDECITETVWSEHQLKNEPKNNNIDLFSKYKGYGLLSFNSFLIFEYKIPVYEFLIDKKYIGKPLETNMSYFSAISESFNYEPGSLFLQKIKKMLEANV